jgi:hypothetical protein
MTVDPKYHRSLKLTYGLIEFAKFDDFSVHDVWGAFASFTG